MMVSERVSADQARRQTASGEALLVCAYEDEAKCRKVELEGSISLKKLQSSLDSLQKEKEIIFYCA